MSCGTVSELIKIAYPNILIASAQAHNFFLLMYVSFIIP